MVVGVPREIKTEEYRVAVTPEGAAELVQDGHRVMVEKSAGAGSGFSDEEYAASGAEIADKQGLFRESGLIVKVKEPLPEEFELLAVNQALLTFLHLAPNPGLIDVLLKKKISAFGYETLEEGGKLPLLAPMSEIAGRMAPLVAAYYLQKPHGGSGVLPSGATGVRPANIVILGAGVVGTNAARIAHALGMRVTVINRGVERLSVLDEMFEGEIDTLPSTAHNIGESMRDADAVVGAVLVSGERAPVVVSRQMVSSMKKGSVIVDVSIDQGGCIGTSRPTSHAEPTFEQHGVIHYAVTNMPGAYPRTSTLALTNSTLPYIKRLAKRLDCLDAGPKCAMDDPALHSALNICDGKLVHAGLKRSLGTAL